LGDSLEGWFEFPLIAQICLQYIKVQANENWKDKTSNDFKNLIIPLAYKFLTILLQLLN